MVKDMLSQRVPMAAAKRRLLEKQMVLMKLALKQWQAMSYDVPDEHRVHHLIEHWNTPTVEVNSHE